MENFNEKLKEIKKRPPYLSRDYRRATPVFRKFRKVPSKDEVLPEKYKEMISLALAINVRCDNIANHVNDAVQAGASDQEIAEVIELAVLTGGRPSIVYGNQALEALIKFEKEDVKEFFF